MKERPILFSGAMVRAILSGRKTQTRRVVKPIGPLTLLMKTFVAEHQITMRHAMRLRMQGHDLWLQHLKKGVLGDLPSHRRALELCGCPYGQTGDRLWVKETHFESRKWRHAPVFAAAPDFIYRADYEYREELSSVIGCHHWRPSIFMKREASRVTLEILSVRVERLQDISEADALAEGIERDAGEFKNYNVKDKAFPWLAGVGAAVLSYKTLWESINGAGSWKANPWVWVVEFKRI